MVFKKKFLGFYDLESIKIKKLRFSQKKDFEIYEIRQDEKK